MRVLALFSCTLVLLAAGCSTEVEVYASPEAIFAVYGVLNPDADSQVVRVSQVFQTPGDAYAFAETYDPSLAGLELRLIGPTRSYRATWREGVPRDPEGAFGPTLGYYRFETADSLRLQAGLRYQLEIRSGDTLRLLAQTRIPPRPEVTLPRVSRGDGRECLPTLAVEDSLRIFFRRNADGLRTPAYGYQVRIRWTYFADGERHEVVYGPGPLIRRSLGCDGLTGEVLCYQLGQGAVLRAFQVALARTPASRYAYEREPRCVPAFTGALPRSLLLDITAVDTALGEYMTVHGSSFRSLNPRPPFYTNLSGTHRSVGVFGAVARHQSPGLLSGCAEAQLGLSDPLTDPCR